MGKSKYGKEEVEAAIVGAGSIAEVMQNLGMRINNGRYSTIKNLATKYDLALPMWDNRKSTKQAIARNTIPNEEFFILGVPHSGSSLKRDL
jgi:hypothetical protein